MNDIQIEAIRCVQARGYCHGIKLSQDKELFCYHCWLYESLSRELQLISDFDYCEFDEKNGDPIEAGAHCIRCGRMIDSYPI